MRNKVLAIASAAVLMIPSSVLARNSHPYQPRYTPSQGPNYNQTNNVPEFNPAYPRSYYYNQDNTVPPPPLAPEIQDQYRLQHGRQPQYRLVNPQPHPEQPRRNRGSHQYQSSSPYPEQPQQNRGSHQYQPSSPYPEQPQQNRGSRQYQSYQPY